MTRRVIAPAVRRVHDVPMTEHETLIDCYLTAYGEPDEATRADLIARAFAPDAVLADPPFAATGHEELSATFAAVQEQFPGHTFARTSVIDAHHDAARYTWTMDGPDGASAVAGTDFVRFGPDGRIITVAGFFGEPDPRG